MIKRRTIFVFLAAIVVVVSQYAYAAAPPAFVEAEHGRASLKIVNGYPVVHVYGKPEEMGEQIGTLLAPQIKFLINEYLNKFLALGTDVPIVRDQSLKIARQMEKAIPAQYIDEMKAMAKAAGVEYDDVLLSNTVFDIKKMIFCSAVIATGEGSEDGKPVFSRNLDFPTLGTLHTFTVLIVYHPAEGKQIASIAFPGLVGILSAMNDAGVTAAVLEVHRREFNPDAMPYGILYRHALSTAENTADVVKTVTTTPRTTSMNLMICDAAGDAACAELAPSSFDVRKLDKGILIATNIFQSEKFGGGFLCRRLASLTATAARRKVNDGVGKKMLADVSYEVLTIQSMIIHPDKREFLLAAGKPPSTKLEYKLFDATMLFSRKEIGEKK